MQISFLEFLLEELDVLAYFAGQASEDAYFREVDAAVDVVKGFEVFLHEEFSDWEGGYVFAVRVVEFVLFGKDAFLEHPYKGLTILTVLHSKTIQIALLVIRP